jgi:hypothetical protein
MAAIIRDGNRGVSVLRYAQVRHMKEMRRAGVNPASGGFTAGSVARIVKSGKSGKEIY